jgi:hypothetical protein
VADAESSRVALVRLTSGDAQFVGSGLLVNDHAILTADHIAIGFDHRVDFGGQTHEIAEVIRSGSPQADLAILILRKPVAGVGSLRYARVDRTLVTQVSNCAAVGFPRWKGTGSARKPAQVNGTIPTAEGLEQTADAGLWEGFLTLVGNRDPVGPPIRQGPLTEAGTPSRWGGMSGAVVTAGGAVVGVVRSVNLAADNRSLTVTPLTALETLSDHALRRSFWDALGIPDPDRLHRLPEKEDRQRRRELARSRQTAAKVGIGALAAGALAGEAHGRHYTSDKHSNHPAPADVRIYIDHDHWGDGAFHDDPGFHDTGIY